MLRAGSFQVLHATAHTRGIRSAPASHPSEKPAALLLTSVPFVYRLHFLTLLFDNIGRYHVGIRLFHSQKVFSHNKRQVRSMRIKIQSLKCKRLLHKVFSLVA